MPFLAPEATELVEPLGAGTTFDVALVREGRVVLVCKRLTSRARVSAEGRAAIIREARALSLAQGDPLPRLVRVGSDAQGPYVLQTRTVGPSIRELVDASAGHVPALVVRHVAREAARALAALHERVDDAGPLGLVHGDLGPDHVIVDPMFTARFVDLGAARYRGIDPSLLGSERGTLPFVPPEVARSEAPPSMAADVYALAASLLFLALGRPLTAATEPSALLAEIGDRGLACDLAGAAVALLPAQREALARAVAFEPAARIGSARRLFEALDAAERASSR